ncbi:MAG: hypothetical protein ACOC97_04910 [Myxococcota bacterium]
MGRCRVGWCIALAATVLAGCGQEDAQGVLPGVEALVFAKRAYVTEDGSHNVAGGSNQTIDYLRYVPGGGVYVLDPPTPDGELRNLTEDFDGVDVNGLDVSFDGRQVAFSMRREGDEHYHLYIANVDGSGEVRQLTFGDYDDVKPIWVPGDRIAFVTNQPYTAMGTRADEYNHSRVVTQLATVGVATGDADRRVCSQNLSHSADPFLLEDGRIAFSRWEHLGPVNDVKLFAMNPDCTQMVALAGQHGKPGNSLVQMQEEREGVFVGVVTSRERTIQAGALYRVDVRAETGVSSIEFDEQQARFEALTPSVPTDEASPPSGVGRYRRPFPLRVDGEDRYLVSWANGDVNDRDELSQTAPNFGIYLYDPERHTRTLVYDDPETWDLYAVPARPREIPPVHSSTVPTDPDLDYPEPAVLGSVDVAVTSLDETVRGGRYDGMALGDALLHAERVRVIEGFSSEIGPVREFGLTMHEGAAILGEVPVYDDGSWEASVPSLLPYHLQPIDEFGMAIRNEMTWVQAMPGENRRCGGCHEGRAETVLPRSGDPTTTAQQVGPVDLNVPIPERTELPWAGAADAQNIQELLDDKCAGCHSPGGSDSTAAAMAETFYTVNVTTEEGEELEFDIPYLDLSSTPQETYYEMDVVEYPVSYVSLLYPSAMMGDAVATGDVPPEWVIPGAARESRLIEKVNALREGVDPADATADDWAWSDAMPHPEDVGVELTREERMMLIRMADLGGQYWSRRNVDGADQWGSVEY